MPRATRAAAKALEQAEEAAAAASIALPPTPKKERQPLGEISHNSNAVFEMVVTPENDETKPAAHGKKGTTAKKGKKGKKTKANKAPVEVLEDDDRSSHSDATDEARDLLLNTTHTASSDHILIPDADFPSLSDAAAEMAVQKLSPEPQEQPMINVEPTMHLGTEDPQAHGSPTAVDSPEKETIAVTETNSSTDPAKEDSFVEHIHSRSPAKRVSRIEDSVEALDALEDAIEKIGEAIPGSGSELSSPKESRKPTKVRSISKRGADAASAPVTGAPKTSMKSRPLAASSKPVASRPSIRQGTAGAKNGTSRLSVTSKNAPSTTRKVPEVPSKPQLPSKRVSSIHKTPFQPVKSSKPPTKSTFELPGEAVARKLKEQREERQKREEQGSKKSGQTNPRVTHKRQAPEVKMTATARARLSLAQSGVTGSGNLGLITKASPRPAAKTTLRPKGPKASEAGAIVPTKSRTPMSAATSVKAGSPAKTSPVSRQLSVSSQPRNVSDGELVNQKTRGKEVFSRPKQMLKAKETERKAKEEAAKKARIEAAERGRLASREWAEKQKARKLAAQGAKASPEGEEIAT